MALAYWEKGIEVEPDFADNYRNASKFLSTQNNHLWTWLYGQAYLALTLEYGQPDVEAMNVVRKSLFSLFNMSKQTIPKQGLDAKFFDVLTPCGMGGADAETLAALEPKLKCFIESWSKDTDRSKNPVFDQLQQVLALDKLTEFMFWLYGETDREEMNAWGAEHAESFNEFSTWIFWNGIEFSTEKPFNRLKN